MIELDKSKKVLLVPSPTQYPKGEHMGAVGAQKCEYSKLCSILLHIVKSKHFWAGTKPCRQDQFFRGISEKAIISSEKSVSKYFGPDQTILVLVHINFGPKEG